MPIAVWMPASAILRSSSISSSFKIVGYGLIKRCGKFNARPSR